MTEPPNPPAAGWYHDPTSEAEWRWWDGTAWTSLTSGPAATQSPAPAGQPFSGQLPAPGRPAGTSTLTDRLNTSPALVALIVVAAVVAVLLPIGIVAARWDDGNKSKAHKDIASHTFPQPTALPFTPPTAGGFTSPTTSTTPCTPPEFPPNPPQNAAELGLADPGTTVPFSNTKSSFAGMSTSIRFLGCGGSVLGSKSYRYDPTNAIITVGWNYQNAIAVGIKGDEDWSIQFGPPQGRQLARGVYDRVQGFPGNNPVKGGFSISGDGRGCSAETSTFKIYEVTVNSGVVTRLLATFERHCGDISAELRYGIIDFAT